MRKVQVVFIAPEEYNNLGVGYLCAVLRKEGYGTAIIDFSRDKWYIVRRLKHLNPLIIGFSLVSYGFLPDFIDLISFLRKQGISCHFSAGGHYPSLNTSDLFSIIDGIDSVVRYEGEYTMLELTACISAKREWRGIDGIAYRNNGSVIINRNRVPEKDLDNFPFPVRTPLRKFAFGLPVATLLAGRGCLNNCSFCNTKLFYREAGGPLKRIRKPEMVVQEINTLYTRKKCSIFLFMDDDFPVKPARKKDWTKIFCESLTRKGLDNKILWKICCRPDEVSLESFSLMKNHGLFLVFIGIEDGTDNGLEKLRKNTTVRQIRDSILILKKLKIGIDFGFMLFQPNTTYLTLNENLDFLQSICKDGYMPVSFLKMIPLYGTPVEKDLIAEGRLRSGIVPGFDFHEESMKEYCEFIYDSFGEWLLDPYGLLNLSKWIRNSYLVYSGFFGPDPEWQKQEKRFRRIIAESNLFMIGMMRELAELFRTGTHNNVITDEYRHTINMKHLSFVKRITGCYDTLYFLSFKGLMRKYRESSI